DAVRCGGCGHEHDPAVGCKLQPKCINCGGAHVATSNDCPLRKIPVGRQQQPERIPEPTRIQGPWTPIRKVGCSSSPTADVPVSISCTEAKARKHQRMERPSEDLGTHWAFYNQGRI
ncbi:hypothetical protein HPB47_003567, partial [Ixodes persulcatus]